MAEKVLLHMQYELEQMGVAIPYDRIAHRLHPGSSAGAIQLFLGWTRERLVAEGHLVPPTLDRKTIQRCVDLPAGKPILGATCA
jgi:hypothetical protein